MNIEDGNQNFAQHVERKLKTSILQQNTHSMKELAGGIDTFLSSRRTVNTEKVVFVTSPDEQQQMT
mgnify:CR=1 FL=1